MITNCPLCGSPVSENKFSKNEFVYKKCPFCGVLFVANELSELDLARYYSKSYYEADGSNDKGRKGYPSYMKAQESLRDSFKQKLQVVRKHITSGRLLDAGAAYGTFLKLASADYTCVGLELSEYAATVARDEFGVDVKTGTIDAAPFPAAHFDVIVMWDIIEHLKNPVRALQEVHRMLRPGGFCFISTDDVNNWLIKLLGTKWWGIAPPLHLCHFSRRGMEVAFERAGGFEKVKVEKDWRRYGFAEIIKHFGTSYQNTALTDFGTKLGYTSLGKLTINIARPEQFIAIARKIN
ncbi:MAG: class I SAM-dependent methyltransferase [Chloroflexi bacterium]|nr:MAG: class I SAM-dependent methyltransferase [Chloroflexota bacterium]